jgi:energy-coupling factor transporter ATP-binding protein EcfA2
MKLENFKIWRNTGPVRLAPITLLLGTNSSGKSSLIQSLLLIRQTVKGDDTSIDLNLGSADAGDSVALGQFKDVLCRHGAATETTSSNQVGIEFRWSESGALHDSALFSARYRKGADGCAELDFLRLGKDGQGFHVQRRKAGIYSLNIGSKRRSLWQSSDFRPERSFAFSPAALNKLGEDADTIRPIGPALLSELRRIIYLGPVRRLAQRDYMWAGRMPDHIGDDGAKAIDALIASGVELQKARKSGQSPGNTARLFEETIGWLKKMDLADDLSVRSLGRSARHELLVEQHNEAANVKDVGVGVSQVIPVVVAALFAKPGHVVIIEEPESHLHPLAQGVLAELLAQVSHERKVQFIIETHSEHLFRRMQTLIAKEVVIPNETAMYFVERDGKDARMRALDVDELGRVMNWPPKFFGDTLGETREQTELAIQRAKALRAKDGNVPN